MNGREENPLVFVPYPESTPLLGGLQFFIERLIRHCAVKGLIVKRLMIPFWFEYGVVWPGLKAGQLVSRGVGTTWAILCRGIYTTVILWAHRLFKKERAICFSSDPALLAFVGWPKQLCMIGVYSEGPACKEEAVRAGVWRENGRQCLGIQLLMKVEKLSCRRASRIVADSPSGWQKMVSLLGLPEERGQVIWQAIDSDQKPGSEEDRYRLRERLGWPEDTVVAIFTGQLYRIKGVDILFEAIRQQRDDRLRLVVLGTGVLESSLREACRSDLILGRRIHMAGFRKDVFDFLRGADIFVLPSRQEGTSTSLLEALLVGLPAVGSDVGGIHDVLSSGECGLLVDPENPQELAKAMRALTDDAEQRAELGRRGREFVLRNCRAEDMASGYVTVFRQLAFADRRTLIRDAKRRGE
jgi:glycosyltransferase involved in cell wall biosynthesis